MLLRPLSFEDSDLLVTVFNSYPNAGAPGDAYRSGQDTEFRTVKKTAPPFMSGE